MTPNNLLLYQKGVSPTSPITLAPPPGFTWRVKVLWVFIHAGGTTGTRSALWDVSPGAFSGSDGAFQLAGTGSLTGSGGAAMAPQGATGLGVTVQNVSPLPLLGHGDWLQLSPTLLAGDTLDWYAEIEEEVDGL